MIRPLKSKDLTNFIFCCQKRDSFNDFYVTKNNKRLFLSDVKVAKQVFNECMKWGNKCYVKEDKGLITAILLVVGYKNKSARKYVKVLARKQNDFNDLFNYLKSMKLKDLFMKVYIKNNHFVRQDKRLINDPTARGYKPVYILRRTGFEIIKVRENEVLLKKEDRSYGSYKHNR